MPCKNIDDLITLVIDHNDILIDYKIQKATCFKDINSDLNIKLKSLEEILGLFPTDIIKKLDDEIEEFKQIKELHLIQKAITISQNPKNNLIGEISQISEINNYFKVTIRLFNDIDTEYITPCCGSICD